ncbi:hypothetical protein Q4Q34_01465 [Flavivirga abyssicola]|uniref:hypothetical protein n=1 Tax=Flavivirga abyssicola TaxID=3063533 RepID=UPI0026E028F6|nr:hypothetical protein [Flavivirga sp. MEBiC07777]WVK13707.1 hypothetical protein Q4Q34_01465 [Flavivirga sp. MEBiC07777]
MKYIKTITIKFNLSYLVVLFSISCFAQDYKTVSVENNYKDWGWDNVHVAKNKYISLAVVPDAGGRILEYNLGEEPSLWLNPKLKGKKFPATDEVKMKEWRNFGGYRLVPIPVENCSVDRNGNKGKRWPPPAIIGDAKYDVAIKENKLGHQTIEVKSGVQQLPVPRFFGNKGFVYPNKIEEELQYSRSLYIEPHSSLVYIDHTLKNVGETKVKRGLKISSQHVSETKRGMHDGENYVAYIPFDKNLKLPNGEQFEITTNPDLRWQYLNRNRFKLDKNNPEHIEKYYNHGTNWKGEVAPGIYEVEYDYNQMAGFHIIASDSWLCYVNKKTNTAFAKIMEPYNPQLEYDHGLNNAIFCSGLSEGYIETEVMTPLYNLEPNESFNYREIHGAAKIENAPILNVNLAGVTTQKMAFDLKLNKITGIYGVFIEGKAILRLLDASGNVIKDIKKDMVNPLKSFSFEAFLKDFIEVKSCELYIEDVNGKLNLLDSYSF